VDNLIKRTLTGIFIVIFVLGGFWLHPVSFFITGLVLVAGTQFEYYRMIKSTGVAPQVYTGMLSGSIVYTLSTLAAAEIIDLKYLLLILPLISFIMVAELFRKQTDPFNSLAHTILPLFYTVISFSLFPFSAFSGEGIRSLLSHEGIVFSPGIVVGFFILLWANDTGAYLIGVSFGRHRLIERISPKKSWEGFIGGLLIAALIAFILGPWLGVTGRSGWIIVSLIISVAGTLGDLVESMLKRSIGVKDSGTLMPGHGGFLDRFDGVFLSFPVVYLYLVLLG
jgi:phosphatidate cytidylyltransferase